MRTVIAVGILLVAMQWSSVAKAEFETTPFLRNATILLPPLPVSLCIVGDPAACEDRFSR